MTQFEDDADLAILAALNSYNMQSTTEGASIVANIQKHKGLSPVHDEEKEEDDESSEGQGSPYVAGSQTMTGFGRA